MSRESGIGVAAVALALASLALDHLVGSDPGLEDPPAFLAGAGVVLVAALLMFGVLIPRTRERADAPERAAVRGLVCSAVAVLTVPLTFLGLPFVVGAAGIALGLLGRAGPRRRVATAAVVVGALVMLLGVAATDFDTSD